MSASRRVAMALVGADLALFAFFFALALASHSATIVVPRLALPWELATAGLETIRWFPAAHLFAAILAVSSVAGETEAIVVKVAAPAVVMSALVAAAALILGPICQSSLDTNLASSARFSDYLGRARVDLEADRLEASRIDLEILSSISENDIRLVPLQSRLAGLESKIARSIQAQRPEEPDPASARAAWRKARSYYEKGDWYNAHWQATLALRLDPSLVEAKRLAALAWEEIARVTGSTPKDEAEAAFFAEKFRGYGLLRSGDYIGAWRVFDSLSKDHGADPEVRRYLRESLDGIDRTAFYRDEADDAFAAHGIPRFFLRYGVAAKGEGAKGASTKGERILAALDSGWTGGAAFFKDLEFLDVKADGSALYIRAPWAKITGGRLFLVAADRSSPGSAFRAEAFAIEAGGSSASEKPVTAPASLETGFETETLLVIAEANEEPRALSFLDSISALTKSSSWGLPAEKLTTDVLDRLGLPFASFGSAIVGLLLGLRFRPTSPKVKRSFSLPAVPFIGAFAFGAWWMIKRLDGLVSLWSARALAGMDAIWLATGIRSILVVVAMLLVIGATRSATGPTIEHESLDE
ncbi:MAG TPA: hypothetical protein VMV44_12420 [Rectinemataceae bacterium]|nr:hypothetical protein [Rectinemataceae bacterium]